MELSVTTAAIDDIRRQLTVELSAGDVAAEFDKAFQDLGKSVNLPGFRRGRVPRPVLEKQFGRQVAGEIFDRLIRTTLGEAIRREQLQVAGVPQLNTQVAERGRELRYEATIELVPVVEARDYKGIGVTQTVRPLREEDVDNALERLRERYAQWLPETERKETQAGDAIVIDYRVMQGGRELGHGEGTQVIVGQTGFPPEVEEQLAGKSVGETISADCDLKDPRRPGLARVTVTIQGLLKRELPALDDDFAKDHGECESLEELRGRLRDRLRENLDMQERNERSSLVLTKLVEMHTFEVPSTMVDATQKELLDSEVQRWARMGVGEAERANMIEQFAEPMKQRALSQVRLAFLLKSIADQESLEVANEEIDERMQALATNSNVDVARVREFYADENRRDQLLLGMRREKAADLVVSSAAVERVEADPVVADAE